jgi:hypothetical protein
MVAGCDVGTQDGLPVLVDVEHDTAGENGVGHTGQLA